MITRRTVYLVVSCALVSRVACLGVDYYVDAANGNDRNTGRSDVSAWKSIARVNAYKGFVAGDRILLKRGQVWREQLTVPASGIADRRIVVGAYGTGSRPVLKGSALVMNWTNAGRADCWRASLDIAPNQVFFDGVRGAVQGSPDRLNRPLEWTWSDGVLYVYAIDNPDIAYTAPGVEASVRPSIRSHGLLHIQNREYVTVQDIDITQSYSIGLYIKPWARCITIRGCGVSHSLDGGLVASTIGGAGASQIVVEDCLVHHNNGGYKEGVPGVATYHEGLTMENVDGFVVRRTRVYDNYMEGVNFKRGARNGLIEYCDLHSNDLINLYLEGAANIVICYNRIYDCTYNAGIEFGLETNTYGNDTIRIHHNLFWNNSGAVSFWAGAVTAQTCNISIDNNTFYNNEFGIRWKSGATDNYSGANYIRNNLIWPQRIGWTAIKDYTAGRQGIARTVVAHNAFQKGAPTDATGISARMLTDPQMVSPSSLNFHLRAGSICIDNGMDVGLARDYDGTLIPQGHAPDIGADEYLSAALPEVHAADVDPSAADDE